MQGRHLLRVLGHQASPEDVAEQVVVPVPGALPIQRDHEQVGAVQLLEDAAAVRAARDRVAQRHR